MNCKHEWYIVGEKTETHSGSKWCENCGAIKQPSSRLGHDVILYPLRVARRPKKARKEKP